MSDPQNNYPQSPVQGTDSARYQADNPAAKQPQYGYGQPQRPRYGYGQPQQSQYNYEQPQQPQYNYGQPQQPQYNYSQPAYRQPEPYAQPMTAAPVQLSAAPQYKKAIASLILTILALPAIAAAVIYYVPMIADFLKDLKSYDAPREYMVQYELYIAGAIALLAGVIVMLVGAALGGRGHVVFGVGVLLMAVGILLKHIVTGLRYLDEIKSWPDYSKQVFLLYSILFVLTVLAGVGCLTRVKALSAAGGALMLIGVILVFIVSANFRFNSYKDEQITFELLGVAGFVLASIAAICFPLSHKKG